MQSRGDLAQIMPINLPHCPSKRPEFFCEGIEVEHILSPSKALDSIVVYDDNQIIELMLRCEQDSFPVRALVQFPVAQQYKRAKLKPVPLGRQRHAATNRKTVPQRA